MKIRNIYTRIHNRLSAISLFDSIINTWNYLNMRMMGCKVGRDIRFYGLIHIYRLPINSRVIIGNKCVFRSRKKSNPLGLVRPCIIALSDKSGFKPVLKIGDRCAFSGVCFRCFRLIEIGNRVRIGANTIIMDGDDHDDDPRTTPPLSIIIEDNVFIGANCIIKKGVRIGRNSVIGMGSVVTKNIPANSVAVGVPCKAIRELSPEIINKLESL